MKGWRVGDKRDPVWVEDVTVNHRRLRVEVHWAIVDSRMEPKETRVRVLGDQTILTATTLNGIRFKEFVRNARAAARSNRSQFTALVAAGEVPAEFALTAQQFVELGTEMPGPHSGRKYSESELKLVADLYRTAHRKGLSAREFVAKERQVSLSTADKQIRAARDAGLLEPSMRQRRASK
jgi:hypothetical protein